MLNLDNFKKARMVADLVNERTKKVLNKVTILDVNTGGPFVCFRMCNKFQALNMESLSYMKLNNIKDTDLASEIAGKLIERHYFIEERALLLNNNYDSGDKKSISKAK